MRYILSSILAATSVLAQPTGEFGRKMMYYGGYGFYGFMGKAIVLGLAVLVWLWVVKLWQDVRKKRR